MHHFFAASVCLFLFCWAAAPSIHADNNVVCPDQRSKCPEGTTCCQMPGGSYGCCPMPHAVCCSDQMHCCPADTQCDLQHQQCLNNPSSSSSGGAASSSHSHRHAQPWHRKFPASRHEEQPPPAPVQQSSDEASPSGRDGNVDLPVICPDRVHVCPAHSTCCPMDDGQRRRRQFWRRTMEDSSPTASYSCCPAEQAVCCSDHEHCCPQGSQCDLEHEACIGGSAAKRTNLLRHHEQKAQHKSHHQKQQSPPASAEENDDEEEAMTATARTTVPALHRCGGRGATKMGGCPLDSKCCRHRNPLDGRKLDGCCPFSNGQCCALTEHCCPQGFACDHSEGRCISEQRNGVTLSTQMFPTRMPQQLSNKHAPKVCPDGSICHHRGTCCPRQVDNEETTTAAAAGGTFQTTIIYDCCPMEKANCCPGAQVCCPHGFKCSASANKQKDGECQRMSVRELVTKLFLSDDGI